MLDSVCDSSDSSEHSRNYHWATFARHYYQFLPIYFTYDSRLSLSCQPITGWNSKKSSENSPKTVNWWIRLQWSPLISVTIYLETQDGSLVFSILSYFNLGNCMWRWVWVTWFVTKLRGTIKWSNDVHKQRQHVVKLLT